MVEDVPVPPKPPVSTAASTPRGGAHGVAADPASPSHPTSPSVAGVTLVVAGAGCLSLSAIFIRFADVNAGTAAFLRCAIALVFLLPVTLVERRRRRGLPRPLRKYALLAGAFLGVDYVMWTVSIMDIGAAVATVLLNVQVIAFPLLARLLGGQHVPRRFLYASPVMLAGLALAAGVLDHSTQARNPVRGAVLALAAGVAYAAYLYLIRLCGVSAPRHVVAPVCLSTFSAAVVSGVLALLTTGLPLAIPAASWGWLAALALLGQVVAWLLVTKGTSALTPNVGAALLLLQPIMAVVFAMLLLGETPTPLQLTGCGVVVTAVWFASHTPRASRPGDATPVS